MNGIIPSSRKGREKKVETIRKRLQHTYRATKSGIWFVMVIMPCVRACVYMRASS